MKEKNAKKMSETPIRMEWLLAAGAVFVAAGIGFAVPRVLQQGEDTKRLTQVAVEETEPVRVTPQTELSIREKTELFQSADASAVVLNKGKRYDEATIAARVEEEIEKLQKLGVLERGTYQKTETDYTPLFYVDSSGEKSMILWQAQLYLNREDGSCLSDMVLDDETGKLLGISMERWDTDRENGVVYNVATDGMVESGESVGSGEDSSLELEEELKQKAEWFASYLGLETESVSMSPDMTKYLVSAEEQSTYREQVKRYMKKGYSEDEARRLMNEEWGLTEAAPDGSVSAQVIYREGEEQIFYDIRLGKTSISINPELTPGSGDPADQY